MKIYSKSRLHKQKMYIAQWALLGRLWSLYNSANRNECPDTHTHISKRTLSIRKKRDSPENAFCAKERSITLYSLCKLPIGVLVFIFCCFSHSFQRFQSFSLISLQFFFRVGHFFSLLYSVCVFAEFRLSQLLT